MIHSRSLLRHVVAGVVGLVLAASAFFMPGGSPAHADDNTAIQVVSAKLTHVTETGTEITEARQLYIGDYFYLDIEYDASKANLKAGDSLTVEMPSYVVNRDAGNARTEVLKPLEYRDASGQSIRAGECKIESNKITCTFNEAVEGKLDVMGTLQAQLVAWEVTPNTSTQFVINGKSHDVAHPWGEDIAKREGGQFRPEKRIFKTATGVGSASKAVNWMIVAGGAWLAENYPNGGPITITDEIQAGMELPSASAITLTEITPNAQTGLPEYTVVARGDGSGQVNGFSIVPTFEGRTVTFTLTGPFNTDYNYRVITPTPFTGGQIVPGHNYVNQAYFVEADQSTNEYTRSYFESFKATISYRQGFGGFNITKGSAGNAVPPAGQKFTVSVAYELPRGKTAADFPGWTNVPASNPTTMEITVGATTAYPFEFPMGTKVTLTEDVASANPAATDLIWGAPKFSSEDQRVTIAEDGAKASFTIADREALPVTLTNTATGLGQFSVTKRISGDDADAYADQEFTFAYTCSDGTTGSLTTSQAKGAATIGERLPAGTTCEVTEQAIGDRSGYTFTAPEAQNVTIKTGEVTALTFVNAYERDKGSFSITKQVAGDAADLAPQSFTFSYQCADMAEAKTVEAVAGQSVTVDGVATGSCTVSEAAAEAENTTSTLEFMVDGAAVAANDRAISFDVAKGAEVKVQATNTYTANKGTFQVSKSVQGIDPQAAGSFEFAYVCSDDSTGKLTVPGDGTAVKAETSHRVGVTCEVTEVASSAEREGYTVETPQPVTVTVAADSSKVAEFVNVYTAKPAPSPSPEPSPTPTPEQAPATPSPSPTPEQTPATPTAAPTSEQPSATPTPSAPATTAPATSAPTTAEQSPVATPSPVKPTVKPGLPKTGK